MPRFSANISMMFREREMLERPRAARAAGFAAVEVQSPYRIPVADWRAALAGTGLGVAVINLPVGDLSEGGPGSAAMPGKEAEFRAGVEAALAYAEALGPRAMNILPGWPPAELGREACIATLVDNARFAADALAPLGVVVTIEACNRRDRPGFLLARSAEVMDALDRAAHPNLKMEYDLYHMQIMEGDLVPTLERLLPRIGHIQFADTPGRHEPGTGEINFATVFAALDRLGWEGFVGAEYVPSARTEDTLGWLEPYRDC